MLRQSLGRYLRKRQTIDLNRDYELIDQHLDRAWTEFVHPRDGEIFRKAVTAHTKQELHYRMVMHVMPAPIWCDELFWSEKRLRMCGFWCSLAFYYLKARPLGDDSQ